MKKIFILSSFLVVLFVFGSSVYAVGGGIIPTDNSLTVTTPPTKINYTVGEALNLSGLVVSFHETTGVLNSVPVSLDKFASVGITTVPANNAILKATDTKVTIKKTNYISVEIAITVKPAFKINKIEKDPTSTAILNYKKGEKLNLEGLKVKLTALDGTSKIIPFADFGTNGITTSIEQKAILKLTDKNVVITTANKKKFNLPITVSVDKLCVTTALSTREGLISGSTEKYTRSMADMFSVRSTALLAAWNSTTFTTIERDTAIKTAWTTFKASQKTARDLRSKTVKDAWTAWKTAIANCGTKTTETQALDLL